MYYYIWKINFDCFLIKNRILEGGEISLFYFLYFLWQTMRFRAYIIPSEMIMSYIYAREGGEWKSRRRGAHDTSQSRGIILWEKSEERERDAARAPRQSRSCAGPLSHRVPKPHNLASWLFTVRGHSRARATTRGSQLPVYSIMYIYAPRKFLARAKTHFVRGQRVYIVPSLYTHYKPSIDCFDPHELFSLYTLELTQLEGNNSLFGKFTRFNGYMLINP